MSTRQEQDSQTNAAATSAVASQQNTEMLDTELEDFLNLENLESTMDLERMDSNSQKRLMNRLTRKVLRVTSLLHQAEVNLYSSMLTEYRFKRDTILRSTGLSTSAPSETSTKQSGSMTQSKDGTESQSDISQSKNVTPNMSYQMTKLSRESSVKKGSAGNTVTTSTNN